MEISKKRIQKHQAELLEINQLLFLIKRYEYTHINKWVTTRLKERIKELEVAIKSQSYKKWTEDEINWIKKNYKKCTAQELAIDMKRSTATVKRMINKLSIKK